jgi:hypothetical protein
MAAVTCALLLALTIIGPAFRRWFGAPLDFNTDYTSKEAFRQALTIQGIALGLVFLLLGMIATGWGSRSAMKWSLWAANPASIGLGYLLYRKAMYPEGPWEYFSYQDWATLSLFGPILLVPCAILGLRIGRRITTHLSDTHANGA